MYYTYRKEVKLPHRVLKIMSGCTWLLSIAIAAPPLFGWSSYIMQDQYHCANNFKQSLNNSSYIMFCLVFGFLGPFVLCLATNIKFLMKVKDMNRILPVNASISVFIMASMIAFLLAWLPMVTLGASSMFGMAIEFPISLRMCSYVTKLTIITDTTLFLLLNKKFRKCTIVQLRLDRNHFNSLRLSKTL